MQKKVGKLILSTCLLVGLVNLVVQARSLTSLSHDSAISLVAASAHHATYATTAPSQRWATAAEWQRLWSPQSLGAFGTIARDLGQYDIHPPLYFWLLHLWLHGGGGLLSAGFWMNVVWHVLTAVGIWAVCRALAVHPWAAAIISVGWVINGALQMGLPELRQYPLLGLLVIAHALAVLQYLDSQQHFALVWVILSGLAGLLTHYYFALCLLALLAWVVGYAWRHSQHRALWAMGLSYGLAGLLFLAFNPAFVGAFAHQRHQAAAGVTGSGLERLLGYAMGILPIFLPTQLPGWLGGLSTLLLAVLVVWYCLGSGSVPSNRWAGFPFHSLADLPVFCLVVMWGLGAMLQASGSSPLHAIGPKYLLFLLPLVFVVAAQLLSRLFASHLGWELGLALVLLLVHSLGASVYSSERAAASRQPALPADFNGGHPIILDTTRRGILPVILFAVSPQTPVLAADQPFLLAQPQLLDRYDCVYYASSDRYENELAQRERILANWSDRGYQHQRQDHWQPDQVDIFLLWRPAEGASHDTPACPGG